MLKPLYSISSIVICNFGWLWLANQKAIAQVTTDNIVGTQVNQNGSVREMPPTTPTSRLSDLELTLIR